MSDNRVSTSDQCIQVAGVAGIPDVVGHATAICMQRELAIQVDNVWKTYETGQPVLENFSMAVPKGAIYALLGSSGCGKTTALSCIVGRLAWDSGTISVLGSPSFTGKCIIEPRKIGYMPQDLALQILLTTREIVTLYGVLYGMSKSEIKSRLEFLQKFLQLPSDSVDRVVGQLSGGQQRRASIAVALVHEPDLIILDEPTVGLDPLLRESIWEYLIDISNNMKVTIILTTHYIDEARRSDMVGLMRNGRIIAEESPEVLMRKYETSSLDSIVLEICKQDAAVRKQLREGKSTAEIDRKVFRVKGKLNDMEDPVIMTGEKNVACLNYKSVLPGAQSDGFHQQPSMTYNGGGGVETNCFLSSVDEWKKLFQLVWVVGVERVRNPGFIWITMTLSVVTLVLIQNIFSSDLRDLRFGIVENNEIRNVTNFTVEPSVLNECQGTSFSRLFLHEIAIESDALALTIFRSSSDALREVKVGNIWGYLTIPNNYTDNMQQRMLAGRFTTNETLDGTVIRFHLDMSSYLGSVLLLKKLGAGYSRFLKRLSKACGLLSEELEIPLKYEEPVFGSLDGSYAEHVVPGFLVFVMFTAPVSACAVSVLKDRMSGAFGRLIVAGATGLDLGMAQLIAHGFLQCVQAIMCTLILVWGYSYEVKGSLLMYTAVIMALTYCGVSIGFLIGLTSSTLFQAVSIIFGLISFIVPFSGSLWPIEILQITWRTIAYILPCTLAAQSLRSLFYRGVASTHILVWPGLVNSLAWTSLILTIGISIIRKM